MRSRFTIFVLTFVIVFAMANTRVSFFKVVKNDTDTVVSGSKHDTVKVDSAITEKNLLIQLWHRLLYHRQ